MESLEITDNDVYEVWNWCSEAYIRYGRKLSFPENTDPKKTYQWRYVKAITKKFKEWDFDAETSKRFIDIAVSHIRDHKMLHKGLSLLHQKNMLANVYSKLEQELDTNKQTTTSLADMKKWVDKQIGDRDPVQVMLSKRNLDSLPKLVEWYQGSKVSALYISLSKSCSKAAAKLAKKDEVARSMLPQTTQLYLLRSNFLRDVNNKKLSRRILQEDWRSMCL